MKIMQDMNIKTKYIPVNTEMGVVGFRQKI